MTAVPSIFPFSKLRLPHKEALVWVGYNPTFHRFTKYGLAISDVAFYVCSRGWLIARWRRYPLADISNVTFAEDKDRKPAIIFQVRGRNVAFSTPYDSHTEEVDFDRGVLLKAVNYLRSQLQHE